MELVNAVKKVITDTGKSIDKFDIPEYQSLRKLTGLVGLSNSQLKSKILSLRKHGKIGPLLGGTGPAKISELVCPHCNKRYGP